MGWWKINKLASILHHSIRIQSLDALVFSPGAFVSLYFDPLSHLGGGAPPEPRPSQECLWQCTEREPSVHGMCKPTNTNTRHKYKTSKPRSCVSCFEWSDPHCSAGTLVAYQFKSLCSSTKLFVSSTNWSISMSLSPKVPSFSFCPQKQRDSQIN